VFKGNIWTAEGGIVQGAPKGERGKAEYGYGECAGTYKRKGGRGLLSRGGGNIHDVICLGIGVNLQGGKMFRGKNENAGQETVRGTLSGGTE